MASEATTQIYKNIDNSYLDRSTEQQICRSNLLDPQPPVNKKLSLNIT